MVIDYKMKKFMPNFILIELPSPKEFEVDLKGSVLAEENEVESFFLQ